MNLYGDFSLFYGNEVVAVNAAQYCDCYHYYWQLHCVVEPRTVTECCMLYLFISTVLLIYHSHIHARIRVAFLSVVGLRCHSIHNNSIAIITAFQVFSIYWCVRESRIMCHCSRS